MITQNFNELIDQENVNYITDDIINIFSANKKFLTKNECEKIIKTIYGLLFNDEIKPQNIDSIFKTISTNSDDRIFKKDLKPIVKALIVSFDVNYINHTSSEKVHVKIVKLLPESYSIEQ